jgi:hypothetical protein
MVLLILSKQLSMALLLGAKIESGKMTARWSGG